MPTGTGAVSLRNLPTIPYEVNPGKFFALTEKNIFTPSAFAAPDYGQYTQIQLLQVGVVSKLVLLMQGVARSTAAATPTYKWPYGVIQNIQVSGNGVNNFINCTGYDLFLRKQAQFRAYVDNITTTGTLVAGASAAAGSYPFTIEIEIPLAMDDSTLVGSLYAQSEATNLTVRLQMETEQNLFGTNGVVSLLNTSATTGSSPSVSMSETFFEVPYDPQKAGTVVIPDLTVLHGIIANDNPVAGLAEVTTQLYRINGQMERLAFYTDNSNTLVLTTNYSRFRLIYGGSQTPQDYNPALFLRALDNTWYRIPLPDGAYIMDSVAENPQRDQILLEGITNLRLVTTYATGFTPNANAYVHFVQETLFA